MEQNESKELTLTKKEKVIKWFRWFFFSFIWLGVLLLIIDFVSKQIVLNTMSVGQTIEIIPHFFSFQYVVNDGMAFGLDFNNAITNRIIFITASVIGAILIVGIYVWKYKKLTKYVKACLMIIGAGCIGNLIDRAFYSAEYLHYTTNGVVDFIAFDFGTYAFPRFNIADSCLVIGTIMLVVWLFVSEAQDDKKKKAEERDKKANEKVLSLDEKKRLEQEADQNIIQDDSKKTSSNKNHEKVEK